VFASSEKNSKRIYGFDDADLRQGFMRFAVWVMKGIIKNCSGNDYYIVIYGKAAYCWLWFLCKWKQQSWAGLFGTVIDL
jgi:hypothetical protein